MGLINRRFPFPKFREMETPTPAKAIKYLQSQEMEIPLINGKFPSSGITAFQKNHSKKQFHQLRFTPKVFLSFAKN